MPRSRIMYCQDDGLSKGWWTFQPIDLRRKHYKCLHCQKEHKVKEAIDWSSYNLSQIPVIKMNERKK